LNSKKIQESCKNVSLCFRGRDDLSFFWLKHLDDSFSRTTLLRPQTPFKSITRNASFDQKINKYYAHPSNLSRRVRVSLNWSAPYDCLTWQRSRGDEMRVAPARRMGPCHLESQGQSPLPQVGGQGPPPPGPTEARPFFRTLHEATLVDPTRTDPTPRQTTSNSLPHQHNTTQPNRANTPPHMPPTRIPPISPTQCWGQVSHQEDTPTTGFSDLHWELSR
jgi:hypothetical protein